MLSNSSSEVPLGDSPERSSAGTTGPSQVPADDDDLDLDVADSTIIDLEDGVTFWRPATSRASDVTERYEVFGLDVFRELSEIDSQTSFLQSHWLVDQGEG
jgi:hypothetical protein